MAEQFKTYESIGRQRTEAVARHPVRGEVYVAHVDFLITEIARGDRTILELKRKLEQKA